LMRRTWSRTPSCVASPPSGSSTPPCSGTRTAKLRTTREASSRCTSPPPCHTPSAIIQFTVGWRPSHHLPAGRRCALDAALLRSRSQCTAAFLRLNTVSTVPSLQTTLSQAPPLAAYPTPGTRPVSLGTASAPPPHARPCWCAPDAQRIARAAACPHVASPSNKDAIAGTPFSSPLLRAPLLPEARSLFL
jgi:hypothetical protein